MVSNDAEGPEGLKPDRVRALQEAIGSLAERHGVAAPVLNVAPEIYIGPGTTLRDWAMGIGEVLRDPGCGIFLTGQEVVTIDAETGGTRLMGVDRFRSRLADYVTIGAKRHKETGEMVPCTIPVEGARGVLQSDHFTAKLPRLAGINGVKQPVRRRDGRVELLPQGYDRESQIYTLEGGLDYDENMPLEEAVAFWRAMFSTFPWPEETRERMMGSYLAAALSMYAKALMPPGALIPMFVVNANMGGSGKSLLAKMAIWMVYGRAGGTSFPESDEELRKILDTAAQSMAQVLFFDDKDGFLESRFLNEWLTSNVREGRVLGTNQKFVMQKTAVTWLTGNEVRLREFLQRRSVIIDLFSLQNLKERVLPEDTIILSDEWMAEEENRKRCLSALWAFVRYSCVPREEEREGLGGVMEKVTLCGRVDEAWQRVRSAHRPIDSFETWSRVIPQIVIDAKFGDPLDRADIVGVGDTEAQDFEKLIKAVIHQYLWRERRKMVVDEDGDEVPSDEMERVPLPEAVVMLKDIVRTARRLGLYSHVLETTDEVLHQLERGRGATGFWEDVFPGEGLKEFEKRMPSTDAERLSQAEEWYDKKMANTMAAKMKGKQGQFITGACGNVFKFGERVAGRLSRFRITRATKVG